MTIQFAFTTPLHPSNKPIVSDSLLASTPLSSLHLTRTHATSQERSAICTVLQEERDPSQEKCSEKEEETVLRRANYAIPKRSPPHLKLRPSSSRVPTQFHGPWLLPCSSSSNSSLPSAYSSISWQICDRPGSPMAILSENRSVTTGTVPLTSVISLEKSVIISSRICCRLCTC